MADTINLSLDAKQPWFSLTTGGNGCVTSGQSLLFVVSGSAPSESLFGHRLSEGDTMEYSLSDNESLWVKTDESCIVVHTRSDIP